MKKGLKLGLKIAGLSVAWIPASVLALATIDVPTNLNSQAPLNKRFFRNLAENEDESIANAFINLPITQISMLGSHDALSDDITINSRMDPYSPNNTKFAQLARYIGPGALVRLSRAQYDDIYTQLNAGVRYVDARITCIDGKYYTHHTMLSNTLEHYLMQILRWLDENPGEFIFFHIYYFNYNGLSLNKDSTEYKTARNKAWADLKTYIESVKYKGNSLFSYDYTLDATIKGTRESCLFGDLTYKEVCPDGKAGALIFFSSDDVREASRSEESASADTEWCYRHIYDPFAKNSKYLINPCAGTMKSTKVVAQTKQTVQDVKNLGDKTIQTKYLRYCQTQTTPNINDIGETLTAWSLIQKAHDHNAYMLRKSGINWTEVFEYVPIYMCDFCTDNSNGFCQEVIDKMAAFNLSLCK